MIQLSRTAALSAAVGTAALMSPQPAAADDAPTICFVTFSMQVEYFRSSVAGGERAAEDLGIELIVLDPQADASTQGELVEDCIARQVDGIVLDPIEAGSVLGPIDEAEEAGIPVITLDTEIDHANVIGLVGVPQFEASYNFGLYVAGYIAGAMGGEANIGLMIASSEVQLARRDGFLEAMEALPDVEIAAEADGRNILERAMSEAENMLTANPQIDLIYATGDPQLQGGLSAAQAQDRDIAFFGWDDIPEPFLAPLEEGRLVGFLKQEPDYGGEMGVRLMVDHLAGEEVPEHHTYTPVVVTPYNLEMFR